MTKAAVDSMLAAAMHAAPNGKVQQAFTKMANDMRLDGESNERVVAALAGGILDGVRFGNWPE